MKEWFISRSGEKEGPFTAQEIGGFLADGQLNATEAFAWKEGMPDWKLIADSGVVAEAELSGYAPPQTVDSGSATGPKLIIPAASLQAGPTTAGNPYAPPQRGFLFSHEHAGPKSYRGIGRLAYSGLLVGIILGTYAVLVGITGTGSQGFASLFKLLGISGVAYVASLWVGAKRAQNLGMSGSAALWTLVPIMNVWISWRMFACPEGYHDSEQLDTAGKVLTGLQVTCIAVLIISEVLAA